MEPPSYYQVPINDIRLPFAELNCRCFYHCVLQYVLMHPVKTLRIVLTERVPNCERLVCTISEPNTVAFQIDFSTSDRDERPIGDLSRVLHEQGCQRQRMDAARLEQALVKERVNDLEQKIRDLSENVEALVAERYGTGRDVPPRVDSGNSDLSRGGKETTNAMGMDCSDMTS